MERMTAIELRKLIKEIEDDCLPINPNGPEFPPIPNNIAISPSTKFLIQKMLVPDP